MIIGRLSDTRAKMGGGAYELPRRQTLRDLRANNATVDGLWLLSTASLRREDCKMSPFCSVLMEAFRATYTLGPETSDNMAWGVILGSKHLMQLSFASQNPHFALAPNLSCC